MTFPVDHRNQSESLIHTLETYPELLRRLDEMPVDTGTVTIESLGGAVNFSHPAHTAVAVTRPEAGGQSQASGDAQGGGAPTRRPAGVGSGEDAPTDAPTGTRENPYRAAETVDLDRGSVAEGNANAIEDASPRRAELPPEGFVPRRHVAMLGQAKRDDTEYRLVGRLGAGGTGVVYQAHQRAIDREVAVKVLRDHLATDAFSRGRFLTEARVIGALDHPNVIALHELCEDETGALFYSMKRVDGTSWDEQIESMPLRENIDTLTRVAGAMRYAHSRGIIHRDLKPENVMLGRYGEVLLADWGLAINQQKRSTPLDRMTIGGTPAYMAPELAAGDVDNISFRTDVYLLGGILFQILTGRPPHHGKTLMECIRNAANNVLVSTRVDGELMEIALRAMATAPEDRHESVEAFIDAIHGEQTHRESTRLVKRAAATVESTEDASRYENFRVAEALLHEAIDVWPENKHARGELKALLLKFARSAADQGDLDLAVTLLDKAGEGQSELARRIHRRRDDRAAKHERDAKFSAFFTHSPEAGLLTRVDSGEVIEANCAFTDLLGYRPEEIVGRLMGQLDAWKCPQARVEFVDRLKAEGRVDNFEATFVHKDGRTLQALISARKTEVNRTQVLVSSIRDISLRKKAEQKLQRSQRRLRDLQRLAGLGSWSYDVAADQVEWSDELYALVGRPKELGPPSFDDYVATIHPDDRPAFLAAVQRTDEGAAYEVRIRQGTQSGRYRTVIARGQPILGDDGEVVELYGVMIPTGPLS